MKTLKKIMALLLVIAFLVPCMSCDKKPAKETEITLTDQAGRTVTLPQAAEKVVSCYYVTTYAMLALGKGDKLVGIEKKADTRPIYGMTNPGLLELPAVGSMKEIDVEKIASLSPDLVILPKKLKDQAETLEGLGIRSIIVSPESDAELREMLVLLGKALGCEEKAEALLSFYDEKLNGFTAPEEKPTALFLGNSEYLTAAPEKMYQSDVIALAGGVNAFSSSEETYWATISYEMLLEMDPEVLIIPSGAEYSAEDLYNDAVLQDLSALKNQRVYEVPDVFEEWDSPIPSGVLGVLWLRLKLHPELYSSDEFAKDVKDFYETFYGFTPTEEQLNTIR